MDKTVEVEFDEYPGKVFRLRVSPVSIDDYLEITGLFAEMKAMRDISGLVDRFAPVAFVGWDGLEDEPTLANLRKQDMNLVLALVSQWIRAIAKAPLPLPVTSGAGGPSKARRASKSRRN